MPLTPEQERGLDALAADLTASDPGLARALSGSPSSGHRLAMQLVGLSALLVAVAAGLVPLAMGLGLGLPWLAGIGAVTTCSWPFLALWVMTRLFPRSSDRLKGLG